MSESTFPKRCTRCDRIYTREEWLTLKRLKPQRFNDPDNEDLSLRNCGCGSTLAVPESEDLYDGALPEDPPDGPVSPELAAYRAAAKR